MNWGMKIIPAIVLAGCTGCLSSIYFTARTQGAAGGEWLLVARDEHAGQYVPCAPGVGTSR